MHQHFLKKATFIYYRKARIIQRQPRLGPSLNEIDFNSLQPEMKILSKEDIDVSTKQIKQNIDQINNKLSFGEKETILAEASKEDPTGYVCEKQVFNISEVSFVEKIHCYNTTEEVCSLVSTLLNIHFSYTY